MNERLISMWDKKTLRNIRKYELTKLTKLTIEFLIKSERNIANNYYIL